MPPASKPEHADHHPHHAKLALFGVDFEIGVLSGCRAARRSLCSAGA
jgi:hypothetical protein